MVTDLAEITTSSEKDGEFTKNLDAFQHHLPLLLVAKEEGRWAVGRYDDTFRCWDTWNDALQDGYFRYGLKPFLVQKVEHAPAIEHLSLVVRLSYFA